MPGSSETPKGGEIDRFDLMPRDFVRPEANEYRYSKGVHAGTVTVYYSREVWGERAEMLHRGSLNADTVVERFTVQEFEFVKPTLRTRKRRSALICAGAQ